MLNNLTTRGKEELANTDQPKDRLRIKTNQIISFGKPKNKHHLYGK